MVIYEIIFYLFDVERALFTYERFSGNSQEEPSERREKRDRSKVRNRSTTERLFERKTEAEEAGQKTRRSSLCRDAFAVSLSLSCAARSFHFGGWPSREQVLFRIIVNLDSYNIIQL